MKDQLIIIPLPNGFDKKVKRKEFDIYQFIFLNFFKLK